MTNQEAIERIEQHMRIHFASEYPHAVYITEALNLAIEALKEREPRVMPADEIVLSAEPSKWLWVERKGDYCAEAYKAGKTVSGLIAFDSETPGAFLYCEYPGEYGKTWRCWTSRPTDEQRKAVKWNEGVYRQSRM